jgi:hypothetical protein
MVGLFSVSWRKDLNLHFAPHYDRTIELPIADPLLIRLTESVGNLPSGFVYELPRFEAERLIMRRKATAVGTLGTIADLTLSDLECREAGL